MGNEVEIQKSPKIGKNIERRGVLCGAYVINFQAEGYIDVYYYSLLATENLLVMNLKSAAHIIFEGGIGHNWL